MKKLFIIFLTLFSFDVFAQSSGEGFLFSPTIMYRSEATKEGGAETETTEIFYNLKFGYKWGGGFYLGGVYDVETDDAGVAANDGDRTSYGGSVGYVSGVAGFNGFFSYLLNSKNEFGNNSYEGNGYIVDLAYSFAVGSWGIGPVLQYRKFKYDKNNGAAADLEETLVIPMIQFMFMF